MASSLVVGSLAALFGVATANCNAVEVDVVEPLLVISIAPSHGAIAIDPSTTVMATFSRPIDVSTAIASSCSLAPLDGQGDALAPVDATLALSDDGQTLVLTPTTPLAAASRHRVTLSTDIADVAGTQLAADVTAEFTTL
ncbi:MAG: Ig-like domain-containing protein [Myxococcota bacterium]